MFWPEFFWNQTDDLPRYPMFFFATGWNKNSNSICAILFRPAAGTKKNIFRHFQCLSLGVVHGQLRFFFSFPILSFKITSARAASPMLEHFGDFYVKLHVSFWQKQKQEFRDGSSTKKNSKKWPAQSSSKWWWREHSANEALWLESLSIRPGMFPEFPTGNFA